MYDGPQTSETIADRIGRIDRERMSTAKETAELRMLVGDLENRVNWLERQLTESDREAEMRKGNPSANGVTYPETRDR